MRVYLSGTITADPRTHEWRKRFDALVDQKGGNCDLYSYSPMRKKDPEKFSADGLQSDAPPSLFVRRDLADIRKCDAMLIYFPKNICPDRQSIGTWAEFGVAIERNMLIVVVSDDPKIIDYPFIKVYAAAVVPTLEEAIATLSWLDNS